MGFINPNPRSFFAGGVISLFMYLFAFKPIQKGWKTHWI